MQYSQSLSMSNDSTVTLCHDATRESLRQDEYGNRLDGKEVGIHGRMEPRAHELHHYMHLTLEHHLLTLSMPLRRNPMLLQVLYTKTLHTPSMHSA